MSESFPILRWRSSGGRLSLMKLTRRSAVALDPRTEREVRALLREVDRRGDAGLVAAVARLDGVAVRSAEDLRLTVPEAAAEAAALPGELVAAVEAAIERIEAYHRPQVHAGYRLEEAGEAGLTVLEERRTPLARVGVYVPGGRASYPSTVMMTVIPARLAGVPQIVVATPPRSFATSGVLRYTLARLGITEVWGMGGAHAIAALAYGTATIPRVDKIVGPGNAWVTAAKQRVAGRVAIDGIAGPTEVLIVADETADPSLLAADLLAQAEHDVLAAALLLTTSEPLARAVAEQIERQLAELSTASTARQSLAAYGGAWILDQLDDAVPIVEAIAPEHVQLVGPVAEALVDRVRSAGAIFLGASTPEVFGDYFAGPSHVLPTAGSARFASGLGVEDFIRRSHVIRASPDTARAWAGPVAELAQAEGLPAHAAAARRRAG